MLHAFKLTTGPDNASHVAEGPVTENDRTDVIAIHFEETPPHSSFDWHDAPSRNTSSRFWERSSSPRATARHFLAPRRRAGRHGLWEWTQVAGIDDQPWRRAYVVLKPGAGNSFVPKP